MSKRKPVEDDEVDPDEIRVGAVFNAHGALAGLMLVLTERECAAIASGLLVHHAAPSCFDTRLAQPVPVVMCRPEAIARARDLIETIVGLLAEDVEVKH